MTKIDRTADRTTSKAYLVGGGIASLAAAAFMIRDGDMLGHNITIIEESGTIGGSLDGSGTPETGYVLRGGRMIESKYLCTFALFDSIPTLDDNRPELGRPSVFSDHVEESKWISFTTTLHDPRLLDFVRDLTGNVPGKGGLITFPQSSWLASIVIPHQPHFIGQPDDVNVFWGYGLSVDAPGDFVKKPMSQCSGREIMTEILGHLRLKADDAAIIDACTCIPCMMPFITSQFLRREAGDRPQVVPDGYDNLALMGQFCELPDDVVFTVEYSIRAAQTGVYALLGLKREPPPVYKGTFDPRVLYRAFLALHDFAA